MMTDPLVMYDLVRVLHQERRRIPAHLAPSDPPPKQRATDPRPAVSADVSTAATTVAVEPAEGVDAAAKAGVETDLQIGDAA